MTFNTLLNQEIDLFKANYNSKNFVSAKHHLGRAHVLSQNSVFKHLYVHLLMLKYALERRDIQELSGQFLRLIITIPGHLIGKVPKGNTGWASVGLMEKMPLPSDLKDTLKLKD